MCERKPMNGFVTSEFSLAGVSAVSTTKKSDLTLKTQLSHLPTDSRLRNSSPAVKEAVVEAIRVITSKSLTVREIEVALELLQLELKECKLNY